MIWCRSGLRRLVVDDACPAVSRTMLVLVERIFPWGVTLKIEEGRI